MAVTFVTGTRRPIMCAVDSATVIAKGDLVYLDTDDVKPFTSLGDSGSKAQNQQAAKKVFAGIAGRASANGETAPIPVYSSGVYEFDCASGTWEVGTLVGPIGTGAASAVGVSASSVESVASMDLAIGRVYKRVTVAATRVEVEITSTVFDPVPVPVGYRTGVGGTVTQITNSATAVTLHKLTGQITTVALTTAAAAEEAFTVNNDLVAATDTVVLTTTYAGAGTPLVYCKKAAAGSFDIGITNLHAANALNAAMVINFVVIKGVAA